MSGPRSHARPSRGDAARAGSAVVSGWVLHDLAAFFQNGQPELLRDLVPASLVLVVLGGAIGVLARRRAGFAILLGASLVASIVPALWPVPWPRAEIWLPRSLLLLLVAGAGTLLLRGGRKGLVPAGVCAGLLACMLKTAFRHGWLSESLPLALGLVLALGVLFLPVGVPRRIGTALAWVLPLVWIGTRAAPRLRPSRPDLPPPDVQAPRARPNLILVVLDTVRADHLAPYGYERETTPFLDARAATDFTRYDDARSASSWTLPSHASLFTGLMPAEHGCAVPGFAALPLSEEHVTLAERLHAVGYRTAAVPANQAYLGGQFGLGRGFEHFDDRRAAYLSGYFALSQMAGVHLEAGHVAYRDARTISNLALDWLDEHRDERFFLMLNYMDAHKPYVQGRELQGLFEDREPVDPTSPTFAFQKLLYDRGIWFEDRELERVFRWLEERGLYDDTAIVVTADHGEGLGDHGLFFHGLHLYDALIHVPLFVKPAGERVQAVSDAPIQGAEVHDLMLALLGLEVPARDAAPVTSEYYAGNVDPARGALDMVVWVEGSRKTLVTSRGEVTAFDLAHDPDELSPLPLSAAERESALRRARAWWQAHPIESRPPRTRDRDPEEEARLKALGYG